MPRKRARVKKQPPGPAVHIAQLVSDQLQSAGRVLHFLKDTGGYDLWCMVDDEIVRLRKIIDGWAQTGHLPDTVQGQCAVAAVAEAIGLGLNEEKALALSDYLLSLKVLP